MRVCGCVFVCVCEQPRAEAADVCGHDLSCAPGCACVRACMCTQACIVIMHELSGNDTPASHLKLGIMPTSNAEAVWISNSPADQDKHAKHIAAMYSAAHANPQNGSDGSHALVLHELCTESVRLQHNDDTV